jgi:SpoIID/LytB domain protein
MRRLLFVWVALVCWLGVQVSLFATHTPLQRQLEELYSEKFVLNAAGVPTVTVGVMDGQQKVTFSCPSGGVARLFRKDGRVRVVRLRAGQSYEVRVLQGAKATIRYHVIVFSLPKNQGAKWRQLAALWKRRGMSVQSLETGALFAIRGHLYDTRRRNGVVASYTTKSAARAKMTSLTARFRVPIHMYEEIVKRPTVSMMMTGNGGTWSADSLAEIRSKRGMIQVERVEFGKGYSWHRFRTRLFGGRVLMTADRKGAIAVVNRVALPRYLRGVLRAEMPASAPLEALKAQAVCARNEVVAKVGTRHRADPYLFCAHTHCQVYTGYHRRDTRIRKAIQQTRGQVMVLANGQLSDAPFSALCGGHSEHNEHVWSNSPHPALRGKGDMSQTPAWLVNGINHQTIKRWIEQPPATYCQSGSRVASRRFRWKKSLPKDELNRLVNRKYAIGPVSSISVLKRGVSGRAYLIRIVGQSKSVTVHGELTIRRLFGGLNSSMFLVNPVKDASGQMIGWVFHGGGWGHGVGMCQYGAMARARAGIGYRSILQHYYSGIQLRALYR